VPLDSTITFQGDLFALEQHLSSAANQGRRLTAPAQEAVPGCYAFGVFPLLGETAQDDSFAQVVGSMSAGRQSWRKVGQEPLPGTGCWDPGTGPPSFNVGRSEPLRLSNICCLLNYL
jgi:hypothetical protein